MILTNVDRPDTQKEAQALGVKNYLSKSHYSMKQLAEAIDGLLSSKDTPS